MVNCDVCKIEANGAHCTGCRHVWKRLPEFFGLPGWDVLSETGEIKRADLFA